MDPLRPNLPLDGFGDLFGPFVEDGGVAAFEEEAGFGLGAGIAQEQSAALPFQVGQVSVLTFYTIQQFHGYM